MMNNVRKELFVPIQNLCPMKQKKHTLYIAQNVANIFLKLDLQL